MHLGKFSWVIARLESDYSDGNIAEITASIVQDFNNLASNPGHEPFVASIKANLDRLQDVLANSSLSDSPPSVRAIMSSIGADEFLGSKYFERLKRVIHENQLSPQQAAAALTAFRTETESYYLTTSQINEGLRKVGAEFEVLEPGETELGIRIPVEQGSRTLKDLSKDANQWHNTLMPFSEVFGEDREPVRVRVIATSSWEFYLAAPLPVLYGISLCLKGVNAILRELVTMRRLAQELRDTGTSPSLVQQFEGETKERLDGKARELADSMVEKNFKGDEARKNELKNHMTQSVKHLAKEMTKKVTLEIRVELPKPEASEQDKEPTEAIRVAAQRAAEMKKQIELNMNLYQLDFEGAGQLLLEDEGEQNEQMENE